MAEYSETSSIMISLIIGVILSFLFDNMFVLLFIGFLSTYMTNKEEKNYKIGIVAAFIYSTFNFTIGMIMIPNIPEGIIENIGFDPANFILGFIVTSLISGILGFIGGFVAEQAHIRINKSKKKKTKQPPKHMQSF
ncbi:hypothetical protein [Methanobrevibacter filiformis]|uniref:Permease n=1 Tax=Methanobrevibacter filiformis TaxID=55758 RepID=A0A166C800_9EURY|nr:hypothetical protein [Methanobrevibacter filiformis]KZX12057.1 hypothetical protein MBFIL_12400 [Methanobrevibacter filiformis]